MYVLKFHDFILSKAHHHNIAIMCAYCVSMYTTLYTKVYQFIASQSIKLGVYYNLQGVVTFIRPTEASCNQDQNEIKQSRSCSELNQGVFQIADQAA